MVTKNTRTIQEPRRWMTRLSNEMSSDIDKHWKTPNRKIKQFGNRNKIAGIGRRVNFFRTSTGRNFTMGRYEYTLHEIIQGMGFIIYGDLVTNTIYTWSGSSIFYSFTQHLTKKWVITDFWQELPIPTTPHAAQQVCRNRCGK